MKEFLRYGRLVPLADRKTPLTPHGHLDAAGTVEEVEAFEREYGDQIGGWGFTPHTGFFVLDLDVKNGKDGPTKLAALEAEHGALAPTLEWKTPSGGFARLYAAREGVPNSQDRVAEGIDVRGNVDGKSSGWQACPPTPGYTFTNNVPVASAPEWLVELARKPAYEPQTEAAGVVDAEWQIALARKFLEARLHNEPTSEDEYRYQLACAIRDYGVSEETALELMEWWNDRCDHPRDNHLIEKAVSGAYKYAQNAIGSRVAGVANLIEEDNGEPAPVDIDSLLQLTKTGWPRMNAFNAHIVVKHLWQGALVFDALHNRTMFRERPLTDTDLIGIMLEIQRRYLSNISFNNVAQAVEWVAHENTVDPLKDHLEALEWDGIKRVGTWLTDYCHAPRSEYNDAVGTMILVALVARALDPGCQVDYVPIFEGPQGTFKSTMCRVMAGRREWFTDHLPDLMYHMRDAQQQIGTKWLVELGELTTMRKVEANQLKSFLSQQVDKYRAPYGRCEIAVPRRCVFWGTTNEDVYLNDPTGARRFWPIKLPEQHIDIETLERDRDQLIAEAVELYRQGVPYAPDREFEREHMVPVQEERQLEDPFVTTVAEFLARSDTDTVTAAQVMDGALGMSKVQQTPAMAKRVATVLKACGWEQRRRKGYRVFVRPGNVVTLFPQR